MFTQKKSLQHTIAQLEERIQELEAELKQKRYRKSKRLFLLSTIVYKALSKSINL
ncbi:hypothetical protein ACT7DB_36675 [Bacillus cereus]